jgi:hypothetical protein
VGKVEALWGLLRTIAPECCFEPVEQERLKEKIDTRAQWEEPDLSTVS